MAKKKTAKKKAAKKKAAKKVTKKKAAKKVAKKVAKKKAAKKAAKKVTKKTAPKKVAQKKVAKATSSTKKKATTKVLPKGKRLTKKEIEDFRQLLMTKRAEILGDMTSMSEEALSRNSSAELSHMPLHMADLGSDNYEQELTLGLVESERKILRQIDEALERIRDGGYGICEATDQPISKTRLNAKPWAKYCIEAAREMERGGAFQGSLR